MIFLKDIYIIYAKGFLQYMSVAYHLVFLPLHVESRHTMYRMDVFGRKRRNLSLIADVANFNLNILTMN